MLKRKIFIAGIKGMVGSAIARQLCVRDDVELLSFARSELDLSCQSDVENFFSSVEVHEVYLAAGKVGGIHANNTYPAEFIYQNLMIECNVINSAFRAGVGKLLFLGSSCIYPKLAKQPMKESALLTGELEETNEPYAIAKIAGIKLCESYNRQYDVDYRSVMPTNLYGPHDNFHPKNSHVVPALMRRFHEAKLLGDKKVIAWGSGRAKREFLHVDDMAAASIHVMDLDKRLYEENTSPMISHINVGTGLDCTIQELVYTVANVVGYKGEIVWDTTKPDGAPRKLLNVERLNLLGWNYNYGLESGLKNTYKWFLDNQNEFRS